ncbi:collagenase [Helicoverpa armigera]|uniref:collagenase n=1 Tax=Helicoverpa armigera TaxID=29058 RepID=UPI003083B141
MHVLVLFGLSLIISASASVEVKTNYHDAVGIPTASKILAEEEAILAKNVEDERIVGGALAPANAYPFFGGLLISLIGGQNSVCGSSLVSHNRLVTAAHCWFDGQRQAWQFLVVLGSNSLGFGGTRIPTSHVIMHPQYHVQSLENDVATIYLPYSIMHNANIQPIRLPSFAELSDPFVGRWAVAAGFGKTTDHQQGASTTVNHVALQVISNTACAAVYTTNFVKSSTLCTNGFGGVGICGGDSGGPLTLYTQQGPLLIGVSSFTERNNCQGGNPSGFARVTSFHSFISQHL